MIVGANATFVFIELGIQLAHLTCRKSKILLSGPDFLAQASVFLEQIIHFLLEKVVFLFIGSNLVLILVQFLNNFVVLIGRKTQIFLGVSHLSVQASVFSNKLCDFLLQAANSLVHSVDFTEFLVQVAQFNVLFLENSIKSFDFLRKNDDFVLIFSHFLCGKLLQGPLQLFVFVADYLKLVLQLTHLTS